MKTWRQSLIKLAAHYCYFMLLVVIVATAAASVSLTGVLAVQEYQTIEQVQNPRTPALAVHGQNTAGLPGKSGAVLSAATIKTTALAKTKKASTAQSVSENKSAPAKLKTSSGKILDQSAVEYLIDQHLDLYLNQGKFKGEKGDGSEVVRNSSGQTSVIVGGYPIVTYLPAVPSQNFVGTSLAAFGELSANNFTVSNNTTLSNLTVSGSTLLKGSLSVLGTSDLATTTVSALTVTATTTLNTVAYVWPSANGSNGQVLTTSGTGQLSWAVANTGSGTAGYVSRWTGQNTLGTGVMLDDGTVAGISATTSEVALTIQGTAINDSSANTTISRGLYINPSITRATDFRALETSGYTLVLASTTAVSQIYGTLHNQITINTTTVATLAGASNVYINGAPRSTSNLTITSSTALSVIGGTVSSTTNAIGLYVTAPIGATNNYAATFLGGSVGIGTAAPASLLNIYSTNTPTSAGLLRVTGKQDTGQSDGKLLALFQGGDNGLGTGHMTLTIQHNNAGLQTSGYLLASNDFGADGQTPTSPDTKRLMVGGKSDLGVTADDAAVFVSATDSGGVDHFQATLSGTASTAYVFRIRYDGRLEQLIPTTDGSNLDAMTLASNDPNITSTSKIGINLYRYVSGTDKRGGKIQAYNCNLSSHGGCLAFETNNNSGTFNEAMRIDANGNIGIGTATPIATLAIKGTGGTNPLVIASSTGTQLMTILQNGNVGIGTTTPGNALTVIGSISSSNLSNGNCVQAGAGGVLTTVSAACGSGGSGNSAWTIGNALIYNATSTDLVGIGTITPTTTLFVQGQGGTNPFAIASSTGTQLLTVTQAGNVGMGTNTPTGSLVVQPASDSTSAVQFVSNNGTSVFNVDTTNKRVGVGVSNPGFVLDVQKGTGLSTTTATAQIAINNQFASGNSADILHLANLNATNSQTLDIGVGGTDLTGSGVKNVYIQGGSGSTRMSYYDSGGLAAANVVMQITMGTTVSTGHSVFIRGLAGQTTDIFGVSSSSGTSFLNVTAGGNIGVNSSTPSTQLAVKGSGTADPFDVSSSSNVSILRVTSTGNVGIGTTTPGASLHIVVNGATDPFIVASSTASTSTYFSIKASGNVGVGTSTPGARFVVAANCTGIAANPGSCTDYAELYPSSEAVDKGEIVSVDSGHVGNGLIKKSSRAYDSNILGVVSTNPAIVVEGNSVQLMNGADYHLDPYKPAIALAGRVPVKIKTDQIIHAGDFITSSNVAGVGMKATYSGQVIGQALLDFDPTANTDPNPQILVFIKPGYQAIGDPVSLSALTSTSGIDLPADGRSTVGTGLNIDAIGNASFAGSLTAATGTFASLKVDNIDSRQINNLNDQLQSVASSTAVSLSSLLADVNDLQNFEAITTAQLADMQKSVSDLSGKTDQVQLDLQKLSKSGSALSLDTPLQLAAGLTTNSITALDNVLNITGDVYFFGRPYFTTDTAGFAAIATGQQEVQVTFGREYIETPIVNATLIAAVDGSWKKGDTSSTDQDAQRIALAQTLLNNDIKFIVTDQDAAGFYIVLSKPAAADLRFSWTALVVKNALTFTSRTQTSDAAAGLSGTASSASAALGSAAISPITTTAPLVAGTSTTETTTSTLPAVQPAFDTASSSEVSTPPTSTPNATPQPAETTPTPSATPTPVSLPADPLISAATPTITAQQQ